MGILQLRLSSTDVATKHSLILISVERFYFTFHRRTSQTAEHKNKTKERDNNKTIYKEKDIVSDGNKAINIADNHF